MPFKTCREKIRDATRNINRKLSPRERANIGEDLRLIAECADHLESLVEECIEEAEAAKKLAAESQVRIVALGMGAC